MKKQAIWFPFTQMKTAPEPIEIVSAKGTLLFDRDGKKYIDANSSWWVNVHGHCHPHIGEALQTQFQALDHVLLADVVHPKANELAIRILEKVNPCFTKVFFSDDGSTAIEVALKMAFQFWHNQQQSKKRILAMNGAYHGDTFGAMSIGQRGYFNEPFEHFFFSVDFIDFPTTTNEEDILNQAKAYFETKEFAALILEPLVQGSAGMRMYSAAFLQRITELAKESGVLVIYDEIMTGWGRTGKLFAMDHQAALPDIFCVSKGLTGGVLPLGLTITTNKIFEAFLSEDKTKALLHGHSFTGSALACTAACASLDLFERTETWQNIERINQAHKKFALCLINHPKISEIRHLGTIIALEFDEGTGSNYFSKLRDIAYHFFLKNGILLRPLGNVIFLNPPYCISNQELEYCYEKLIEFADSLK